MPLPLPKVEVPEPSPVAAPMLPCGYAFSRLPDLLARYGEHLNIAVIYSGDKNRPASVMYPTHNPRNWKSYQPVAADIANSLRSVGFRHVHLMAEDMTLADRLRRHRIHFAWLNSGGVQGYNPVCHLPATLEMLGVPYVGHNPLSASILDNKHAFKRELLTAGIPTAEYLTWDGSRGPLVPAINSRFQQAFAEHAGPFIVKPVSGRASVHVYLADTAEDVPGIVAKVYQATHNLVLIERYLPGREFVVSVCGPVISRGRRLAKCPEAFAFSALERRLQPDEPIFTSMDIQPITGRRVRLLDRTGEAELIGELYAMARRVYLDFNLETLVRIDIRADAGGRLHVLEANPKPDLTRPVGDRLSLVCAGLAAEDMTYDDLILSVIANRLDYLLTHRPDTVRHIVELADGILS